VYISKGYAPVVHDNVRAFDCVLIVVILFSTLGVAQRPQHAKPVNFKKVGVEQRNGGVLRFEYTWASSSGNLADLKGCEVGERVVYPGGNPYPWANTPYVGTTPNPKILWVPGADGVAQDSHSHKDFVQPYKANAFTATQAYRYRCPTFGTNNLPGQTGIKIVRTVRDSTGRGCWGYTITKSGARASVSPLTGVREKNCGRAANYNVPQRMPDLKNSGAEIGLSVSLPEASAGLNAPIFFDLTVFNRRAEPVGFDLGLNKKANLELTIWEPAGGVITRTLSSEGFGRSGEVSLPPSGTYVERLLLNEWYEFRLTGTYRIKLTLLGGSSGASGTARADRPVTEFSVQIGPRDPAQLERVSHELADKAMGGATLEESMEAANALSYIRDPLAVDSLARVLRQGSLVEHYAVDGLGRIGNPQAIAALVAAQDHPDEEIRAAARFMLGVLQERAQGASGPVD
jgi:hypothetical protein